MTGPSPSLFAAIATWVLDRGRLVALVVSVLVALAAGGLTRTTLDFSSTSFYGGADRDLDDLQDFIERWGSDDRDLSVLVTAQDSSGVLTVERLEAIETLAATLETDPEVERVVALPRLRAAQGKPTVLERARLLLGATDGLAAREQLLSDRRAVPALLSEDGRHAVVVARLAHSTDDLGPTVETIQRVSETLEGIDGRDGLTLRLGGVPAIRGAFFALTIRDQLTFVPLTMALVGAVLFFAYRHIYAVLVIGAAAGLPLVALVGIMGWWGEPIGLLNQAYFTLVPVIAIADAVHLVERTEEERRAGRSPREAVRAAASHVGWACLMTSLTTGAGFASLAVSPMPILRNFGLFAALGIGLAYASVLVVMPPLLATAIARSSAPAPVRSPGRLRALVRGLASRRTWVLAGFAVAFAAGGFGARQVVVDNRLSDLLEPDHPVAQASARIDEELAGILSLEVDVRAGGGSSLDDAAQERLVDFARWAQQQPEVRATFGPTIAGDAARVSLRTADIGGQAFGGLRQRVQSELDGRFIQSGLDVRLTGTPAVAYRGINRITVDLRRSLLLVFAVVTVLLGALLRDLRLAAISILPNLFPLVVAYGAVGWTSTTLDPLATVILTVALGIAVDDTIHIAARYAAERRGGAGNLEAVQRCIESTGRAVIVTSATLTLALAINQASSFPPLQMLGRLGAAAIVLALVADLTLLPVLLAGPRRSRDESPERGSADASDQD